jgi:hypothetical protein
MGDWQHECLFLIVHQSIADEQPAPLLVGPLVRKSENRPIVPVEANKLRLTVLLRLYDLSRGKNEQRE